MAYLAPYFRPQFRGLDDKPLAGGKIYTYQAGTTTPRETYTDASGSTPNTNPIILDANGECDIWVNPGGNYKFVVADSNDVILKTVDSVSVPGGGGAGGSLPPGGVAGAVLTKITGLDNDADWILPEKNLVVSVSDSAARDAIPSSDRTVGLIAYVADEETNYQLRGGIANADWSELDSGGGGVLSVADITARNSILTLDRYEGLIVYVVTDEKNYQLRGGITNSDWVDLGGGTIAASEVSFTPYGDLAETNVQDAIEFIQDEIITANTAIDGHASDFNNPHGVTKAQVGLGNVDNTSDLNKPISTATQTALNAHTTNTSNPHAVTKAQVGLGNVDNTSDAAKPISTATQAALDGKLDISLLTTKGDLLVKTASGFARLPAGTNGTFLKADSTQAAGLGYNTLTATVAYNVVSATSTYAAGINDYIYASGSSFTITLPTAVGFSGQPIIIEHAGTSLTQVYTLNTTSGQTIGGISSGSYALYTNGETLRLISDGSNWRILDHRARTGWSASSAITIGAVTTAPSKGNSGSPPIDSVRWRREGPDALLEYRLSQTNNTGASAGSGDYLWGLVSGLTVDTSIVPTYTGAEGAAASRTSVIGQGNRYDGAGALYSAILYSSTQFRNLSLNNSGGTVSTGFQGSSGQGSLSAATLSITVIVRVPISGWRP